MSMRLMSWIPVLVMIAGCAKQEKTEPARPNILLMSIDTLRADRLSAYGHDRKTSPNIDALARDGVLFENCFSVSCKTTPSHMSIMTSLYPQTHDIYMWEKNAQGPVGGNILSSSIPTLAEILKTHGYRNVAFTGGANVAGKIGFSRGFEIYQEDDNNEAATQWLKTNGDQPFFMFYHTYYTHDPYLPPPPYDRKYNPAYSGKIPVMTSFLEEMGIDENTDWHGQWDRLHDYYWSKVDLNDPQDLYHLRALYDGCINHVDSDFIGNLLGALQSNGMLDNTLIVITSDHGEEFLEHGRILHDSLYREVTHVPLVMRWPAGLPKGKRVTQLVRSVDIRPTILSLLDIRVDTPVEGVSLLPAIQRDTDLDLTAYADFNDYAPPFIESVRHGNWLLLMDQRLPPSDVPNGVPPFIQLFNVERDIGETDNLAARSPDKAAAMRNRLIALRIECAKTRESRIIEETPAKAKMDPENARKLESLGYVR